MQPSLPVSPQTSVPVSAAVGKVQCSQAGFAGALAKLFDAIAAPQEAPAPVSISTMPVAPTATLTAPLQTTPPAVEASPADAAPNAPIAQAVTIAADDAASNASTAQTATIVAAATIVEAAGVTTTDSGPTVSVPSTGAARREPATRGTQKSAEAAVTDCASTVAQPLLVANVPAVSVPASALPPETTSHDAARDEPKPAAAAPITTPLKAQRAAAAQPSEPSGAAETATVQPATQKPVTPPPVTADSSNSPTSAPAVVSPQAIAAASTPSLPTVATPPAAQAASTPQHTAPAAQIAPALVSLGRSSDGTQHLTVRLDPPDLGRVQIRIDRSPDAQAHVAITVERPETLTLLLRDQPQLQHALDQAGVPATGRSVTFHVATPEPAARADTASPAPPTGGSASMGGDLSHGASRQGGRTDQPNGTVAPGGDTDASEVSSIAPATWLRGGLDITA